MSDQIDPAFKAAYRATQGQPADVVGRPNLIGRLLFHGRYATETQSECTERKNSERVEASERIAELEAELEAARFAERNGKSLAEDSIHAIRELLKAHDVPVAAFIDDHVGNAIAQRDAARAECEGLRAALTPSAETKAAYSGEFFMGVTLRSGREEDYRRVQIPWDSIKTIMAAIAARAALSQKETSNG